MIRERRKTTPDERLTLDRGQLDIKEYSTVGFLARFATWFATSLQPRAELVKRELYMAKGASGKCLTATKRSHIICHFRKPCKSPWYWFPVVKAIFSSGQSINQKSTGREARGHQCKNQNFA